MIILPIVRRFAKIGLLAFMLMMMFGADLAAAQTPFQVERGQDMPYLYWRVQGTGQCTGDFQISNTAPASPYIYPLGTTIETLWTTNHNLIDGTDFGGAQALGDPGRGFPQTYRFRCTAGTASDVAILTINDCPSTEKWSTSSLSCVPKTPRLLIMPTSVPAILDGATTNLTLRYWPDFPVTPTSTTLGYQTRTNDAAWSSLTTSIATVDNGSNKGRVRGEAPGSATIRATYLGLTANRTVTVNAPIPNVCQGSIPSNGLAWGSDESTGLLNNTTNWTHSATDNPGTKCEYQCEPGHANSGGLCLEVDLASDLTPTISDTTPTQGESVTFGGRVRNTGEVSVATDYFNNFQYRWGTTSSWTALGGNLSRTATIAVNGTVSDTSPVSLTLNQSGTLQVQHRVDVTGAVGEVSESNNTRTATFTVAPAACTGFVPLNGTAFDAEESTGLTVSTPWVNAAGDTSAKCQFRCNTGHVFGGGLCNALNVMSNIAPTISSTTARQGANVTFGGQVRNSGATIINTAFTDQFTYRWGTTGTWIPIGSSGGHITKSVPFAIGAVQNDTSASFNLVNSGTFQVQHCVDSSPAAPGALIESIETSSDNCRMTQFNILPPAVPATPRLLICPTTATVNTGSNVQLNLRYWANRSTAPDCTSTGYSTTTNTTNAGNWTTSSSSQATVSNSGTKGTVTGVRAGSPTITATYSGLTATRVVTVNEPRLIICPTGTPSVNVGATLPLSLRYWTTRSSTPDCSATGYTTVTNSGTWSSNVPARATVTDSGSKGVVTGVTAGAVTITANYLTLSATKPVNVGANVPTLTSPTDVNVGTSTARLGATITSDGGSAITVRGTCIGTSPSPTACTSTTGTATGVFTHDRIGLTCGTSYYYRGYADNAAGRGYSPDGTFTTGACAGLPTLTSPTAIGVTATSATLGANVTSNGGATITARGTCWGTTTNPTTNCVPHTPLGSGLGVFAQPRPNAFVCGTTYYYRGYAINSVGTGYSPSGSFTTTACPSVPTVTSPTDTSVGTSTAFLGANVTSNGGAPLTARGTCYSTSANPTLVNGATCLAEGGLTTGIFTHGRAGLTCGTNYFYKGYATNSAGTGYSADGTFTTAACPVARLLVCPVTTTSVVVGSQIDMALRYWANRATAPDCASTGFTVQTNNGLWSSSATATVASVTTGVAPRGRVTGVGAGAATITGRYLGLTATRGVTVTAAPVPTGDFTLTSCEIPIGGLSCTANVAWTTSALPAVSVSRGWPAPVISTLLNNVVGLPQVLGADTYTYSMDTIPTAGFPFVTENMTISCAAGSVWDGTRCDGVPNLVPNLPITALGPIDLNSSVNFRSQVRNIGNDTTAAGFQNNFSYRWGTGPWIDLLPFNNVGGPLAANTTAGSFDDSPSINLNQVGTLSVQYCVDSNLAINEGVDNEDDNCTTADFQVLPPPPATPANFSANTGSCGGEIELTWQAAQYATGYEVRTTNSGPWTQVGNVLSYTLTGLPVDQNFTNLQLRAVNSEGASAPAPDEAARSSKACEDLAGQGCQINDGSDTCSGRVTWDITGVASPSIYQLTRSFTIDTAETGVNVPVVLEYGPNIIQSRTAGTEIERITLNATCESNSFFYTGGSGECQPRPAITITADPVWIRSGATANIEVSITADYDMNCTFPGTSLAGFTHNSSASAVSYSRVTPPLTAAQMVQVSCAAPGLVPVASNQVKVNVLPTVEER